MILEDKLWLTFSLQVWSRVEEPASGSLAISLSLGAPLYIPPCDPLGHHIDLPLVGDS